jgi:hypothetical protein
MEESSDFLQSERKQNRYKNKIREKLIVRFSLSLHYGIVKPIRG